MLPCTVVVDARPIGPGLAAAVLVVLSSCSDTGSARSGPDAGGNATNGARDAAQNPDAGSAPRDPVVLAHGFFGFENFAGVDFATYFYGVEETLASEGEQLVFTPAVDPFNDSTIRGHELLGEIEDIVAETGHDEVHIIGHSQGGLDARVVAHERPDLVASVVTISTPHGGTPIADIALDLAESDFTQDVLDALAQLIGAPLYDEIGEATSVVSALEQMSEQGIEDFGARYPEAPGVDYFSIAGRSAEHDGGEVCGASEPPAWIAQWERALDPIDPLLWLTELVVGGGTEPNDGLVLVSDARYGRFLGCIPADHLDQIGHLFGDVSGEENPFDHRTLYAELVSWLRAR